MSCNPHHCLWIKSSTQKAHWEIKHFFGLFCQWMGKVLSSYAAILAALVHSQYFSYLIIIWQWLIASLHTFSNYCFSCWRPFRRWVCREVTIVLGCSCLWGKSSPLDGTTLITYPIVASVWRELEYPVRLHVDIRFVPLCGVLKREVWVE